MFASRNRHQAQTPTKEKPKRADSAHEGKAAPEHNPVWQSLSLNPASIQPKLTVGEPDDPYEREADQVADRVMRMTTAPSSDTGLSFSAQPSFKAQRKCHPCEDEEEKKLQRKEQGGNADAPATAPPVVHEALNSSGHPLDPITRAFFEPRFGYNFGSVRAHSDARAADAARAVRARAYTTGSDIVFGSGQYAPATVEGKRLLAHELSHVVQQRGGGVRSAASHATPTLRTSGPSAQRVVDPEYVVDEAAVARMSPDLPVRIFFARNSAVISLTEALKIDNFKSGPDRTVNLTLLGLATEDELAAIPTLATDRVNAVRTALATPRVAPPPFNTKHEGLRTIMPSTLANTQNRPNLRFNRAVELIKPTQSTLSPGTPIAPATACNAPLETAFQAAKTMAFDWIDVTRPEVQARPVTGSIAADLDRFFGNHDASTARRVDHNLGLLRNEIDSLSQPANHACADPNLPGCAGALAFNTGGHMTICAAYLTRTLEDRARNLAHEAAHSTAGLRVTGSRNAQGTKDFAYRDERMINLLGAMNPDQALSNSDSYSMFLMTRRAPAAITPRMLPTSDPAPSGFASAAHAAATGRAVALAGAWIRLARQALTDLHSELRGIGTGNPVPPNLGDPRRHDRILRQVPLSFPPILSTPTITGDDLLMIAGVIDSYGVLGQLIDQPISTSPGATTTFTAVPAVAPATTGSLTLTVAAAFLAANERARTRIIVDKLIELVPTTQISVALRASYGAFAEFSRNLHQ